MDRITLPEYLYNITFNLKDMRTVLEPCVPESAAENEDKIIPRVCLSSSIEGCIRAVAADNRYLQIGARIVVHKAETRHMDMCYIWTPQRLFEDGKVRDALETQEYWYCNSLSVERKVYVIEDFLYEHVVNWSCLTTQQIKEIADKYMSLALPIHYTAYRIYQEVASYLESHSFYDKSDEFWEDIIELPWAQGIKISNLKLKEVV